jgi:Reverse transcriptase (RNA-dependent DNA polymerase)
LSQNKNTQMHAQITSLENIKEAYLDLYYSLTLKSKISKYKALNGKTMNDTLPFSEEIITEIQNDLLNKTKLQPARYTEIPKAGGEVRGIYMLPIKERIKCQAVYRVLEPYFETIYSNNLYSFRSSKPSYYAMRSVRRLYLRNYKKKDLYVLKLDIHKYSDYHNHKILFNILGNHGIDKSVRDLIQLFVRQPFLHDGKMQCLSTGTMQGTPLCAIFNNIYIGHIDKYIEENAHFYRRVGDDLIIIDKDKGKLEKMLEHIKKEVGKSKLIIKEEKTIFTKLDNPFNFLGYQFENGKISLPEGSLRKILNKWKKRLKYRKNLTFDKRIKKLRQFFQNKEEVDPSLKKENFLDIVRAYNLVTDTTQIKKLSSKFMDVLTNYFFDGLTHTKLSKTKKLMAEHKFPSLTRVHYWYNNGKLRSYKKAKKSVDKLIKAEKIYS